MTRSYAAYVGDLNMPVSTSCAVEKGLLAAFCSSANSGEPPDGVLLPGTNSARGEAAASRIWAS